MKQDSFLESFYQVWTANLYLTKANLHLTSLCISDLLVVNGWKDTEMSGVTYHTVAHFTKYMQKHGLFDIGLSTYLLER